MRKLNGTARGAFAFLSEAGRALDRPVIYMEVCGTHTTSACRSGLYSLVPEHVSLRSGPGCPVCVTAPAEIDMLLEVASRPAVTLCTYGDMIRVPGSQGSLELARSRGADVRVVYSALDALALAARLGHREVVFAGVGFETTAPGTAAAIVEASRNKVENFSVLSSHRRILPAMEALLERPDLRLDGYLCPGHVSVIIGGKAYEPLVERYDVPCVVAGFEPWEMAEGIAHLCLMNARAEARVVNAYPAVVSDCGNTHAQTLLDEVFRPTDSVWRGLGLIPSGKLEIRGSYARFDAELRFELVRPPDREPAGCACGAVITGVARPSDCALFGTRCTPVRPVGPCMVSAEGTCRAWHRYSRRPARPNACAP